MRRGLMVLGLLVAAFGILFLLQGLNIIRWPASSFMLGRQAWIDRGAVIAVVGLALVLVARRLR
jgi:hypothetical protein